MLIVRGYLLSSLVYEGAALLQIRNDVGVWEVQDLKRLIRELVWELISDSIGHI